MFKLIHPSKHHKLFRDDYGQIAICGADQDTPTSGTGGPILILQGQCVEVSTCDDGLLFAVCVFAEKHGNKEFFIKYLNHKDFEALLDWMPLKVRFSPRVERLIKQLESLQHLEEV